MKVENCNLLKANRVDFFAQSLVATSGLLWSISPTFYERICTNILAQKKIQA
jgi:hypothetical protein